MPKAEQRLKDIDKELIKVSIIDAPGTIMLGLGLYAKFAANGGAFVPILNNESVVNFMLVAGAGIMIWGAFKMVSLGREKARIKTALNA